MNDMNFLHMELISYKYPVIHNCLPYIDNGLYYESENKAVLLFDKIIDPNYTHKYLELPLIQNSNATELEYIISIKKDIFKLPKLNWTKINYKLPELVIIYSNSILSDFETEKITLMASELFDNFKIFDEVISLKDKLDIALTYNQYRVQFNNCCGYKRYLLDITDNLLVLCNYYNIPLNNANKFNREFYDSDFEFNTSAFKFLFDNGFDNYFKDEELIWLVNNYK